MHIQSKSKGFTLLELILVIAVIGLIVSVVSFNVIGRDPTDEVEQETRRLQVLVDMASDYAVLNQKQLGLRIDDEAMTYEFVALNKEDKWRPIDAQPIFALATMPEFVSLELNLGDLPWVSEDRLFDTRLFDESLSVSDEGVEIGSEEDIEPPPPQILLLSSGEITPFELRIRYDEPFGQNEPFFFTLEGEDIPPLRRKGPENR
jgi:general secretion pathway protein H